MCTLTWRAVAGGGYRLFFNRDERHERGLEREPEISRTADGVEYIAPIDSDRGGTWLVANAHGLTVCLLNHYPRGVIETGRESRGHLPLACAGFMRAGQVVSKMEAFAAPERFAPFHLVAVDAEGSSAHVIWDGDKLHVSAAPEFLTSSSFEPVAVQARRSAAYAMFAATQAGELFHWSHRSEDGAGSILMKRADAATRSVCGVQVGDRTVGLTYTSVVWSADGTALPGIPRTVSLTRA